MGNVINNYFAAQFLLTGTKQNFIEYWQWTFLAKTPTATGGTLFDMLIDWQYGRGALARNLGKWLKT
ncbi:MAG: hypothetical protein ACI308_10990 [Muribaculaceae bacterium]